MKRFLLLSTLFISGCSGYQAGDASGTAIKGLYDYCTATSDFERELILEKIKERSNSYQPEDDICERLGISPLEIPETPDE